VPVKTPATTVRRDVLGRWRVQRAVASSRTGSSAAVARVTAFGYNRPPARRDPHLAGLLHHLDQERGDRAMLHLLAERRRQAADAETRQAAARGIVRRSKHLGWYYIDSGRRIEGATNVHAQPAINGRAKPVAARRRGAGHAAPTLRANRRRRSTTSRYEAVR